MEKTMNWKFGEWFSTFKSNFSYPSLQCRAACVNPIKFKTYFLKVTADKHSYGNAIQQVSIHIQVINI